MLEEQKDLINIVAKYNYENGLLTTQSDTHNVSFETMHVDEEQLDLNMSFLENETVPTVTLPAPVNHERR